MRILFFRFHSCATINASSTQRVCDTLCNTTATDDDTLIAGLDEVSTANRYVRSRASPPPPGKTERERERERACHAHAG